MCDGATSDRVSVWRMRSGARSSPRAAWSNRSHRRPRLQTGEFFELLAEEGKLCKVAEGIYFHGQAREDARKRLRDYLLEHGSVTASDARKLLDSTRKYSIPLLEHLDREGFTVRRGDVRELTREGKGQASE